MYITPEQAHLTLRQRRRDLTLLRRIRDYLGELPAFLQQGPRAVIARQVASPTLEFEQFYLGARQVGLPVAAIEFTGDKFCSCNPDKLALAKMTFFHGRGRNGGDKTRCQRIIDLEHWDGKPLRDIRTHWGEDFRECHHRLLHASFPSVSISDTTAWLQRMGGKPALFWPRLLSLFICDGILFENFHTAGQEQNFTRTIIRPALKQIQERFGLQPLIVPLVEIERERDRYWSWYPGTLEAGLQPAAKISGGAYV